MKSKYGYKVCYQKQGKRKIKRYLITNSYGFAEWSVRWYETHPTEDRQTKRLLEDVTWLIVPIKTFLEYKWLWRGCPF